MTKTILRASERSLGCRWIPCSCARWMGRTATPVPFVSGFAARFAGVMALVLLLGVFSQAASADARKAFSREAFSPRGLNLVERAQAALITQGLRSLGYDFADVALKAIHSEEPLLTFRKGEDLTIGEAIVLNEKLSRGLEASVFAARIQASIAVDQKRAGQVEVRWHPSQGFLSYAAGLLKLRMDRASWIPEKWQKWLPGSSQPASETTRTEPFELQWTELEQVVLLDSDRNEIRFLQTLIQGHQRLSPSVNSFWARGAVTTYTQVQGDRKIFVIDAESEFPQTSRCVHRIRTDFNPFARDSRSVEAQIECSSPHGTIPSLETPSLEWAGELYGE